MAFPEKARMAPVGKTYSKFSSLEYFFKTEESREDDAPVQGFLGLLPARTPPARWKRAVKPGSHKSPSYKGFSPDRARHWLTDRDYVRLFEEWLALGALVRTLERPDI